MVIFKYLREAWQSDAAKQEWKQRMIKWRKEQATVRTERPIRLDRARAVGYKAKQGFVVVRQRVGRGGRMRPKFPKGRRPKHYRRRKILKQSYQVVAEQRAAKQYPNLEVLNSYQLCQDAKSQWFEVILVDPQHPNIKGDEKLSKLAQKRNRARRGLTKAGQRSRGQSKRPGTKGREKNYPSLDAKDGQGN